MAELTEAEDRDLALADEIVPLLFDADASCAHNLKPLIDWHTARIAEARAEGAREVRERVEALIAPTQVRDAISGRVRQVDVWLVKARDLRAALEGGA